MDFFINDNLYTQIEGVKCIDGIRRKSNSIIGYCSNLTHKGYLTKQLMDEHACLGKECNYLTKNPEHPYWRELESKKRRKQRLKERKKPIQKITQNLEEITNIIYSATKDIDDMKIKNIHVNQKGIIVVNYYSCKHIDLFNIISNLEKELKLRIAFIRVKLSYKDSYKFIHKKTPSKRELANNYFNSIRKHAYGNQPDLICAEKCGCFYCRNLFIPDEITTYIPLKNNLFPTAVCPYCNHTTVIPEHEDYVLDKQLLNNMKQHYFKNQ